MQGDSADATAVTGRSRDWPIFAGLLGGMVIAYGALAFGLYAMLSTVF